MTTKRFLRFQLILLILLAISLVGNTFSWATRPAVKGGGFMGAGGDEYAAIELVSPEYYVNGNSCTAVTYLGTIDENGVITYDETTPITQFYDNDLTKGETHYFKTVITNTAEVKTNVSLFISGYTDNKLTSALYGVSTPIADILGFAQSSFDYDTGTRYYRMSPIVTEYEIDPAKDGTPSTSKVEWFVFYDEKSQENHHGPFQISDIIFTNN